MTESEAYDEICYYTLSLRDNEFTHQHVVDAFAVQAANAEDKPIRLTFALVGLFLHVEHAFTGREVQLAHIKLGQKKRDWPRFELPDLRGEITAIDVLNTPEGGERIRAIDDWCKSVWNEFTDSRNLLIELLRESEIL